MQEAREVTTEQRITTVLSIILDAVTTACILKAHCRPHPLHLTSFTNPGLWKKKKLQTGYSEWTSADPKPFWDNPSWNTQAHITVIRTVQCSSYDFRNSSMAFCCFLSHGEWIISVQDCSVNCNKPDFLNPVHWEFEERAVPWWHRWSPQ